MEILQTKIKMTKDDGKWKTSNVEAISVFDNAKMERQGPRGKPAQVTLRLPDDWVEEMILHTVGSREGSHQFVLMKIPRNEPKPKIQKIAKRVKVMRKAAKRK